MPQIELVKITPAMIRMAETNAAQIAGAKDYAYNSYDNNIGTMLGEEIAKCYLGLPARSSKAYDLVLPDGRTIDVKTKQLGVSGYPRDSWTVGISSLENTSSKPADIYVFTTVRRDKTEGWMQGWVTSEDFMDRSVLKKKGERDGFITFQHDGRILLQGDLKPIVDLKKVVDTPFTQA